MTEKQRIAEACAAYAARLRLMHHDGTPHLVPSATIVDLIITLERASAGLLV